MPAESSDHPSFLRESIHIKAYMCSPGTLQPKMADDSHAELVTPFGALRKLSETDHLQMNTGYGM